MSLCQAKTNSSGLLFPLLAVVLTGTAARLHGDTIITVTAPNGGEVWEAGTTQLITWETNTGTYDDVEIWLLRDGQPCEFLGTAFLRDEQFEWSICEFVGDSTDYTVRVACLECDPPAEDVSDGPFEITGSIPPPTLTVVSPNGGEEWAAATTQAVTWTSTDPSGYVAAWLFSGGERHAFIGHVPMVDEAIRWDICPYLGDGSDYMVRLTWFDYCGPDVEDFSDAPFTITNSLPTPTLTVASPNGGEVWSADTTQPITWDCTDPSGDVEIWLTDGGTRYDYLGSAPTDGRFDWAILPCVGDGTEYRILVRWSACQQSVEDISDGPFEITGSVDEPVLTVTSPAPSEVWTAGSMQTITWDSSIVNGDVEVALYEGSSFYAQLGRAPVSAGSLTWDICPGVGDDSNYRIRVRLPDCAAEGFSDPFEITGSVTPTLVLTSPVGGEAWAAGSPYDITWESAGLAGQLDIYVPNDGWHHSGHAVVPTADGTFSWPIAPTLEPGDYDGVWIWSYDCGPILSEIGGAFEVTERITPPADFDGDADVDLRDFASFQTCFTGRGPAILDPVCDSFDFEPDGDVDKDDFAEAAASMTGP